MPLFARFFGASRVRPARRFSLELDRFEPIRLLSVAVPAANVQDVAVTSDTTASPTDDSVSPDAADPTDPADVTDPGTPDPTADPSADSADPTPDATPPATAAWSRPSGGWPHGNWWWWSPTSGGPSGNSPGTGSGQNPGSGSGGGGGDIPPYIGKVSW